MPRSSGSVIGPRGSACISANLAAFSILIASRRPTFICAGVERRVRSGPAARRPVAHAVGAVLLEQPHRRDDVALRLRHLLAVGVEHPAGDRACGSTAASRARACARSTVSKSHVRMMSCACGRRSIGNTRANRSGSSSQSPAICGVSDEVAHVSMTSGSPVKPFG